jgi:OmpA-OmpF porin, OOP family
MISKLFTTLLLGCFLLLGFPAFSQLKGLGDKAKQKINQRVNNKVDRAMDNALDSIEGGTKVKKDGDGDTKVKYDDGTKIKQDADGDVKIKNADGTKVKNEGLIYTSKYDFVPGEKIIAFENFEDTEIGDFPARWNTNATAEVVTLNSKEGKWLKINQEGVWLPEIISNLPENFTLELDLGVNEEFKGSSFVLNIGNLKDKEKSFTDLYHHINWRHGHALHLNFVPLDWRAPGRVYIQTATDGNYLINNNAELRTWDNKEKLFAHISLWRQNQRLRLYLNGEKIYDLPKAFEANGKYNTVTFAMQGANDKESYYLLSNIRLASGAPDTRNKLITEGKFVTRGILFDVNSDQIRPESYGALKDIAKVLKENPTVKVKIVGHTDADGGDKANLGLSSRRAAAVKAMLVTEFDVAGDNLVTEGKGESQPVDKNTTAEGKANNRRVEFIKQ